MTIKFLPGSLDGFTGTQEELDEMIAEITRLFETGEIGEHVRPLTEEEFNELPEEVQAQLVAAVGEFDEDQDLEEFDKQTQRKLH